MFEPVGDIWRKLRPDGCQSRRFDPAEPVDEEATTYRFFERFRARSGAFCLDAAPIKVCVGAGK
jgi:hypothetical protein